MWVTNSSIMAAGCERKVGEFFRARNPCYLDDTNAVGKVKRVLLLDEADKRLLVAFGANQSVNRQSLDTVNAEDSILDLLLGGLDVTQEGEGVEGLDLLHASLSSKGGLDNTESVHLVASLARLPGDLRLALKLSSLRSEEVYVPSDLPDNSGRGLLQSLGDSLGLLDLSL
jgi:hypothetical protein